eukprot:scaffold38687_cov28-Prasinocladus_malaysianus.AAC.1
MLYLFTVGHNPYFRSLKGVVPNDVMDKVLGEDVPYDEDEWAGVSPELRDLIQGLLNKDYEKRLTAEQALAHPWFHVCEESDQGQLELSSNVVALPNERKLLSLASSKHSAKSC